MTHEELLAKIDIWKFQTKGYDDTYEVHGILNALLKVVELHRPYEYKGRFKKHIRCSCCGFRDHRFVDYPCETIQAIEKELG